MLKLDLNNQDIEPSWHGKNQQALVENKKLFTGKDPITVSSRSYNIKTIAIAVLSIIALVFAILTFPGVLLTLPPAVKIILPFSLFNISGGLAIWAGRRISASQQNEDVTLPDEEENVEQLRALEREKEQAEKERARQELLYRCYRSGF